MMSLFRADLGQNQNNNSVSTLQFSCCGWHYSQTCTQRSLNWANISSKFHTTCLLHWYLHIACILFDWMSNLIQLINHSSHENNSSHKNSKVVNINIIELSCLLLIDNANILPNSRKTPAGNVVNLLSSKNKNFRRFKHLNASLSTVSIPHCERSTTRGVLTWQ